MKKLGLLSLFLILTIFISACGTNEGKNAGEEKRT